MFLKDDQTLAITLPPHSPADMPSYAPGSALSPTIDSSIAFEVGQHHDFSELVGAARSLITTSINEGFGFSFLEPWTAHKLLWGRKLPDICHDFEENDIDLGHLYTQLSIPLKWIDQSSFVFPMA